MLATTILGVPFTYFEKLFGIATFISLVPQIYKLLITKDARDFSMIFIFGMILANIIFFIIGFIHTAYGLMLGSFVFIIYNCLIVYYYYR